MSGYNKKKKPVGVKILNTYVWPNEFLAAYEKFKEKAVMIDWANPGNSYGKNKSVTPFEQYIKIINPNGEEEWHKPVFQVTNYETTSWVFSQKEGDDKDNSTPSINIVSNGTFTRKEKKYDEKGEEIKGSEYEVVEQLGKALWALDKSCRKLIAEQLKLSEEEGYSGPEFQNEKIGSMFQTHRKYDAEKDKGAVVEKIDGAKKVKLENPIARVKIHFDNDGNSKDIFKDCVNAKRRTNAKTGRVETIIPDASVEGEPINTMNIWKFVTKGSKISADINASRVKIHNFGTSCSLEFNPQEWVEKQPIVKIYVMHNPLQSKGNSRITDEERDMMLLEGMDIPEETAEEMTASKQKNNNAAKMKAAQGSDDEDEPDSKPDSKPSKNSKAAKSDSDDEDDSKPTKGSKAAAKADSDDEAEAKPAKNAKKVKADSDDEAEPETKPAKNAKKAKPDSDDEAEPETKPAKNAKNAKAKPADSDDETEAKPAKKPKAKPVDSDDEADAKPAKKSKDVKETKKDKKSSKKSKKDDSEDGSIDADALGDVDSE